MDSSQLLVFAAAYLAVLVVPGPGVTALVAQVLAQGTRGAGVFIAGVVGGALLWLTIAATGLAVIASTFATLFVVIRYAGVAYLLYLAYRLWTAPARPPSAAPGVPAHRGRLFLTGLAINLGNPKAIAFFLALLTTVVDLRSLTPLAFTEIALLVTAIAAGVLAAYAFAAARARLLLASPRALRLLTRGSSAVRAGTAVARATR
jgi:threonine/homoserine/homoserine lactone efflux protein